jgi:hypothetical protein
MERFRLEDACPELMSWLESKFAELVEMEHREITRQFNRRLEDQLDQSKRARDWQMFRRIMTQHLRNVRLMPLGPLDWSRLLTGLSNELDYGGGHDHHWKGTASPLVSAGKAEAMESDRLPSDCLQSEPLSCLPTRLLERGLHDVSDSERTFADHPDTSAHSEGRTEHRDGKLPMVTSELSNHLGFPSQGSDRQLHNKVCLSEGEESQVNT